MLNEIMMSVELGLIYGIAAIGLYIAFRIIGFQDLTCDGSFALGSVVSAMWVQSGGNVWISLLFALASGCLAGMCTGFLYARCKIMDPLAGILVTFMMYSINLHITRGIPNISLPDYALPSFCPPILILSVVALLVVVVVGYILSTDFGLALRGIGKNKILARNLGVNTPLMMCLGLVLANSLIALGGALFSNHQGFADIGSGVGTIVMSFAAIIIGEKLLPHRSVVVRVVGCIVGAILYRLLISMALYSDIIGLNTRDVNLLTGVLVIVVMCIPRRQAC